MILDKIYSRYAPKRKKSNTLAWVIGVLSFLSLVPLAVRCDKKKREWGFASLLLYVSCGPSKKESGKRELTVSLPGFTHLRSICSDTGAFCVKKPMKPIEIDDLGDLLDETEGDTDPQVIIYEEQA